MSGPARTADVTVKLRVRFTDTATEGEMLDAVIKAVRTAEFELFSPGGSYEVTGVECASVITKSTGGHL